MPDFLKRRGAYLYALLASCVTLLATAFGSTRIHYPVFAQATRLLFAAQPAYGFPIEPGTGYATYWLYSPSCALTFFSLFAFAPDSIGRFLYLALSLVVFWTGLRAAAPLLGSKKNVEGLQLFWIALSFELVGATSAFKIELVTAGAALWAATLLYRGRELWAAAILAVITNWKFQGIPVAGLLILTQALRTRSLKLPAAFAVALTLYFGLPYLVWPASYLDAAHREWFRSLSENMGATWQGYQHVWASLRAWGLDLSLFAAQCLSLAAGAGLGLFCGWESLARRQRDGAESYGYAVALGLAFAPLFSPMSQSLGYIFWAPLLLMAFVAREESSGRSRLVWNALLVFSVFCVSVASSDLVPAAVRAWSREVTLKPYGVFALVVGIVIRRLYCREYAERGAYRPRGVSP